MWKLYCDNCEHRFTITDETYDRFIEDDSFLVTCPVCGSLEVNILEFTGQRTGY